MNRIDLLARIARGDEEALLAFYEQTVNLVFSMALRVLGAPAEAEEVAQEVFLTIWRRAESYDPARGSVTTWLLTITRRRAVDRLRQKARRPSVVELGEEWEGGAETAPMASHLDLHSALKGLPPEQAECIRLIFFGGYTYVEAAATLGVPTGTVKSRVRLAMDKLRRVLLVSTTPG